MSLRLELAVQPASEPGFKLPLDDQIREWIGAALELPGLITVRFVTAEEGKMLNEAYRHKAYATNVLTFPYEWERQCIADLVICPAVVEKEAKEQHKPLLAHYAHLIVHGTLHAQGYDHETEEEAEIMEGRERKILADLGFDDPYQDDTL